MVNQLASYDFNRTYNGLFGNSTFQFADTTTICLSGFRNIAVVMEPVTLVPGFVRVTLLGTFSLISVTDSWVSCERDFEPDPYGNLRWGWHSDLSTVLSVCTMS